MKEKEPSTLEEICTIKSSKVMAYPYYPVADTLTNKGINFLFRIDVTTEIILVITPFKDQERLMDTKILVEDIPKRSINIIKILSIDQEPLPNRKGIEIKQLDFVIGFNSGFLVKCSFKKEGNKQKNVVTEKFNKDPNHKDSIMSKMSKSIFSSDQWYKLQLAKPIRSFVLCQSPKYTYAYMVGNRIILSSKMTEEADSEILRTFSNFDWDIIKKGSSINIHKNAVAIHGLHYKVLQSSQSMIIDWQTQIGAFNLTRNGMLIIADNSLNTISVYDTRVGLNLVKQYKFDLDVKKISYHQLSENQEYLLVMPYDNSLYLFNLLTNQISAFKGHKSFVTQSYITDSRVIISGGCDHRIGLKKINSIKKWQEIQQQKEHIFSISTDKIQKQGFGQTYFLGIFSNTNASRNNDYDFGFGNFVCLSKENKSYAFFSYDFCTKLYKILV